MSAANEIMRLRQAKADIKAAIEAKGLTVPDSAKLDEYDDYIAAIPSGGEDPYPYVEFVGYDGTVLHKMSLEQARSMTALPDGPTHAGLVFEGWTATLEEIKGATVPLTVGPLFNTADGKTRLYVTVGNGGDVARCITIRFQQSVSEGVEVDWGDGSTPVRAQRYNGGILVMLTHIYAAAGDYVITLGTEAGTWSPYNTSLPMVEWTNQINFVRKIEFGDGIASADGLCAFLRRLESVTIPSYLAATGYGRNSFRECYKLAYVPLLTSITTLQDSVFAYCRSLRGVVHLPNLTLISGNNAFRESGIEEVSDLGDITSLGGAVNQGTFYACPKLRKVILPDTLATVDASAFQSCAVLQEVTLPNSITTIGMSAFNSCSSLDIAELPQSITAIGDSAFKGVGRIGRVRLPNLTLISGNNAFRESGIEEVSDLGDITSLGGTINQGTFYNCSSLRTIVLPPTLQKVSSGCFQECSSLTSITVPASVTDIEYMAFSGCKLMQLILQSDTPPRLPNTNALQNAIFLRILVPAEAYVAYTTAANWSSYRHLMQKSGVAYDYGNLTQDKIFDNNNAALRVPGMTMTDYIPVKGGHVLYVSRVSQISRVNMYDADRAFLSNANPSNAATMNLLAKAAYVRLVYTTAYQSRTILYDNTDGQLVYPYETTT